MQILVSDHACRDVIASRLGVRPQSIECEAACRAVQRSVEGSFKESVKLNIDSGKHYYDEKIVDGKYLGYVLEYLVKEVIRQSNNLKKGGETNEDA